MFSGLASPKWTKSLHRRLVLATAAAMIILLSSLLNMGAGLEDVWKDGRDAIQERSATGDVVVVEIDAASMAAFKRWPWPRSLYGRLLDRLAEAHPAMVAFDIDFSAPSTHAEDMAFARAIDAFPGTVLLPTFRQAAGNLTDDFVESLPIEPLRQSAFLASVNVHPDADGIMRDYSYGTRTAGVPRPSMAALLAGTTGKIEQGFHIDQSIDPATIPRISFASIVDGSADLSHLAGKRLFVGATAIELGDRYAVPRNGVLPGVVIQAQAAETLLLGRAFPDLGRSPATMIALAAVFGAAFLKRRRNRLILLAGTIMALHVALLASEMMGVATFQVIPATLGLAAAFAIIVLIGLNETIFDKERTDAASGLRNGVALTEELVPDGQYRIVAINFRDFAEITAMLSGRERESLWAQLIERLKIGSGAGEIFVYRGDNYVWALPADDPMDELGEQLEGLGAVVANPMTVGAHAIRLKPHFGISQGAGSDGADLLARAIGAASKPSSERIWTLDDIELARGVRERHALIGEFPAALGDDQFWVAYQPQLHLAKGQIASAEALVRWRHPTRGELSPGLFIPIFEEEGLIQSLTLRVFEMVIADLARWRKEGKTLRVAVNVSGTLLTNEMFNRALHSRLDQAADVLHALTLEVTETATLTDPERAIAALEAYRAYGLEISIDDYGTGQSTLSYLRSFPASEIKIDQSFVKHVATSKNDQLLVRSTIGLAHELGFVVVAEGIEDAECLAAISEMGCDIVQGWHIGKPVPAAEFESEYLTSAGEAATHSDRLTA
ncbi:MAG: EAL domain-containing protein [Sphingobium sp.]